MSEIISFVTLSSVAFISRISIKFASSSHNRFAKSVLSSVYSSLFKVYAV
uniref:Uncharacterized protein n=1 Tax=Siphoviridae sp. ctxvK3 TaxID=2827975 RepID=A0A8S5SH79_9CAUD|nr:MAG TPA: hypothetical protein [Siphoviridae sp. ctxvK3]